MKSVVPLPTVRGSHLMVALAFTASLAGVLWIRTPPVYLTVDDVTIRMGIEGLLAPGSDPTGFVLHAHAAFGWFLATVQPFVETPLWDIAITVTLILAVSVLLALGGATFACDWLYGTCAVALVLAVALPLFAGLQFTISATAAGVAAVLMAFVELAGPGPRRTVFVALAVVLFLLGACLRPLAAAAGGAVACCMLLPLAIVSRAHAQAIFALVIVASVMLGLFGVTSSADRALYRRDPEWDAYRKYNSIVAQVVEWRGEAVALSARMGWSANDRDLLQHMLGIDPSVHGAAAVTRASALGSAEATGAIERLGSRVDALRVGVLTRFSFWTTAFMVAIVAGVYAGGRRSFLTVMLQIALFIGACIAVELVFKELPFRLMAPLQICLAITTVVATSTCMRRIHPLAAIITASALLTIASVRLSVVRDELERAAREVPDVRTRLDRLRRTPASLFVLHADGFASQFYLRPFVQERAPLPAILLTYNNQNPSVQRFLTMTGRQPLVPAMCADPSIVLVSKAEVLPLLTTYMREHYGVDVRWRLAGAPDLAAWRCDRATAATARATTR